jgi:hypothetical protein
MTLRYLAGASYLDLCIIFGVHKSTFYKILWETLKKLDECETLKAFVLEHAIDDAHTCRRLAAGFAARTGGHILGCIGALDGIALKIEQPSCGNPLKYFCRKLFNAVNVQAICDAERRFTFISMKCAGSTHDSLAWDVANLHDDDEESERMSTLLAESEVIKTGCTTYAPHGFFLAADDAYKCCQSVCAPWASEACTSN